MPAYNDTATTEAFADKLYDWTDAGEADVSITDAAESGWLVEERSKLLVTDHETGEEFLVTVQKVT